MKYELEISVFSGLLAPGQERSRVALQRSGDSLDHVLVQLHRRRGAGSSGAGPGGCLCGCVGRPEDVGTPTRVGQAGVHWAQLADVIGCGAQRVPRQLQAHHRQSGWVLQESRDLWPRTSPFLAEVRQRFEQQFDVLARLDDPRGMYAMCFCEVE